MAVIDLNRQQKTYPFIRLKPNYQQQGSGGIVNPPTPTINTNPLFVTNGIDIIYPQNISVIGIPDPFILITENSITDIVMPINSNLSIRDTFFNVDSLNGDISLDFTASP